MEGPVNYNTSYVHKEVLPFDVFQITSFPSSHIYTHMRTIRVYFYILLLLARVILSPCYFRPSTPE